MPTYDPIFTMNDNAASGTIVDSSGNSHNAFFENAFTSDWHGTGPGGTLTSALFPNTDGGLLTTGITVTPSGTGSFACWAKFDSPFATAEGVMFGANDDGTAFYINGGSELFITDSDGTILWRKDVSGLFLTTGWHHFAFILNADGSQVVYIDNALQTPSYTATRADFDVNVNAMFYTNTSGTYLVGGMADWRHTTAAMTGSDVAALYALVSSGGPPAIAGGDTRSISVAENETAIGTASATGDSPITWSISGGADAGKVAIDSSTGAMTFLAAKNYEAPDDANTDGAYVFIVRADNGAGFDTQTVTATLTNVVIPANTVAPSIASGFQMVGRTLSIGNGTWSNSPTSYAYQWYRANSAAGSGEAAISGATSATYTLQAADATKYITCKVTGINSEGSATAAASYLTAPVVSAVDLPAVGVVIGGYTDLDPFDQELIFEEAISNTNGATVPASLTLESDTPQSLVDFSFCPIAASTFRLNNGGATPLSPSVVALAAHLSYAASASFTWKGSNGVEVTRTLAYVYHLGGDLDVGILDSPLPAAVRPVRIFNDAWYCSAKSAMTIHLDRHLNVGELTTLANSDAVATFTSGTNAIGAGMSGKPVFVLIGSTPVCVITGWFTSTTGPNPIHYKTELHAVCASVGEALSLVGSANVDAIKATSCRGLGLGLGLGL